MSAGATKTVRKRAVAKEGEPSAKSLREIPELSPDSVFLGRGAEGLRLAQGLSRIVRRGRPKKGETAAGTSTRSVRLPDVQWEALDWVCRQRGVTVHAAMREAIVQWVARAGDKLPKKRR